MLVVLWAGMGGFVVLHTALLLGSGSEQTHALVRLVWSGGLVLAIALSFYSVLTESKADEISE